MSDTPRDGRFSPSDPELPGELCELIRFGRAELGSAAEVAELARRLAGVLGPAAGLAGDGSSGGAGSSDAASSGAVSNGTVSNGTVSNGTVSSGTVSSGTVSSGGAPPSPTPGASSGAATAALGARRGLWLLGAGGAAIALVVAAFVLPRDPSVAVDSAATGELTPSGTPPAAAAPPNEPLSARSDTGSPAPTTPTPPAPQTPTPTPSEAGPRLPGQRRLAAPAASRPRVRAPARPAGAGLAETALLEQARAALHRSPAEALELTRRHQARFRHGALAQEREVIAIEALQRLGKKDDASRRAAEFDRRYRGSVHQPRLLRSTDTSAPAGDALNTAPR